MIATKGEPYLKIPEDKLSFIMHNSLGVYAIIAACTLLPIMIARSTFGPASMGLQAVAAAA